MAIEGYTLGQIRHAARIIGDDELFFRALEGDEFAAETLGRFLVGELEFGAQPAVDAERHSSLAL